jgi:hypothetical protein
LFNVLSRLNVLQCVLVNIHTFTLVLVGGHIFVHGGITEHLLGGLGALVRGHSGQAAVHACTILVHCGNNSESFFEPGLEVIYQLGLAAINCCLMELGLRFKVFEFLVSFAVLALKVLHMFKLEEFLLIDNFFSLNLISLQEIISTTITKTSVLTVVDIFHLFLVSHSVKFSFEKVNLTFNAVANFSFIADFLSGIFQFVAVSQNFSFKFGS